VRQRESIEKLGGVLVIKKNIVPWVLFLGLVK
jgi:hypothetical protein